MKGLLVVCLLLCPALAQGQTRWAMLVADYPNSSTPAATMENARSAVRCADAYWFENSYGRFPTAGDVYGIYRIAPEGDITREEIAALIRLEAEAAGVDLGLYGQHVAYVAPIMGEMYGSIGWGTGVYFALTFERPAIPVCRSIAHEFGHNFFGINHASSGGLSRGDEFDAMGHGYGHFGAPFKQQSGFFVASNVVRAETSGEYVLEPYETGTDGPKALVIASGARRVAREYWVEFRTARGFDVTGSAAYTGVLVHLPPNGYNQELLRLTSDPTKPALPIGSSFCDRDAKVKFTPTRIDDDGRLHVQVVRGACR